MSLSVSQLLSLVLAAGSVLPKAMADPVRIYGPADELPEAATAEELAFQPYLDYDTDSCYNVAAVNAQGEVVEGPEDMHIDDCRYVELLDNSNAYVRKRCNNGWCFYLYDYYYMTDQGLGGHANDWEHIGVWVQNGIVEWVSASKHGGYDIQKRNDAWMDGQHPKIVYHQDGGLTHAFRFAGDGEVPENHKGIWWPSTLVDYDGLWSAGVRDQLFEADFGSASIAIKDSAFVANIQSAKPAEITNFDPNVDA